MIRTATLAATLLVALALLAPAARGQLPGDWDPGRVQQTRADLEELLGRYEQTGRSPAYSTALRTRARYEAEQIRTRLQEGDFQVGDQVTLAVDGEAALSGSFNVTPKRTLALPVIGEIPLAGVLRSELQAHLTQHLGRYIRNPVVRARASIRILVSGQVARPGFYVVETETLLSDVLMQAGGPTPAARLTEVHVERGDRRIWDGIPLQQAIAEGRTINELGLRAGDHVEVPAEREARQGGGAQATLTSVSTLLLAVTTLWRMLF